MNRMKDLRERMGISMKEASRRLAIPYTTYVNYEKCVREPNSETLIQIANFYNTSIDYLLGNSRTADEATYAEQGYEKEIPPGFMPMPKFVKKPRLGTIACGKPILAVEEAEVFDDVPEGINCDFTLKCKGDSMINAGILDGDLIAVNKQDDANNGDIVVAMLDGEATVKRFYREPDCIRLQPENDAYEPIRRRDITVVGKVVGLIRSSV